MVLEQVQEIFELTFQLTLLNNQEICRHSYVWKAAVSQTDSFEVYDNKSWISKTEVRNNFDFGSEQDAV